MYTFLIILFILACFSMIIVILMQAGKGKGLAGTFGGAGASTVFGGRGVATFLSKTTAILATVYMILSLIIGYIYKSQNEVTRDSLIQQEAAGQSTLPVTGVPVAPIQDVPGDSAQ